MKFLIDDANLSKIAHICAYYPVDGVTTNPSILSKSGGEPYTVLRKIRELIGEGRELHAQVLSTEADAMIDEAHRMTDALGRDLYIKIPVIPEGLRAIKALAADGYHITATAIYTPMQAYLAAKAGAEYAAPYVNRMDNLGLDGVETVKTIQDIFENNGYSTKVLAASFKNLHQVQSLCAYGIGAATVSPDVIERMLSNASVDRAVTDFIRDFEGAFGKGTTM